MRYDAKERQQLLQRLQSRKLQSRSQHVQKKDDLLVVKINFSEELKQVRLKSRIEEVLKQLREQIGCNCLQDAHIVVAHMVESNIFMESYNMNFLPAQRRSRGKGTGRGGRGSVCAPQY